MTNTCSNLEDAILVRPRYRHGRPDRTEIPDRSGFLVRDSLARPPMVKGLRKERVHDTRCPPITPINTELGDRPEC